MCVKRSSTRRTFYNKSDLYFYDYNLAGSFMQENYLEAKPPAAG